MALRPFTVSAINILKPDHQAAAAEGMLHVEKYGAKKYGGSNCPDASLVFTKAILAPVDADYRDFHRSCGDVLYRVFAS